MAAAYRLDDHAEHNRRGPLNLRWTYVHMIEELARHAGHADMLREQIEVASRTSGSETISEACLAVVGTPVAHAPGVVPEAGAGADRSR